MEPLTIKLRLDPETAELLQLHKPRSLPLATFCALLIERGLDISEKPQTMGEPAARRASSKAVGYLEESSKEDLFLSSSTTNKQGGAFKKAELHPELETVRETFIRFGTVKKGDRGEHGAKLAATGLRKIGEKYGWDVAREQLDLAINNRWNGISLSNYEKFLPKGNTAAQPEHKHPAAREFRNGRFVDEDGPTTNPVLKDLF